MSFIVIFDLSLFVLWRTPGGPGEVCILGGSLTAGNIFFSFVMSILLSINVVGLVEVLRIKKNKDSAKIASLGGIGLFLWLVSTMCVACYLPLITLFGASFSLSFLHSYSGIMKIVALAIGLTGIWMVNRQIVKGCFATDECEF